ncbi:hypothetical protein GCM10010246_04370 [Streptomyces cuspidosporus]|uniref:GlcNAc-PI de-N-acetylase n=1 Tax=Streptomyces cuspidosporus TaxID=66882 RepID=A0ABN3FAS6_9ACTN
MPSLLAILARPNDEAPRILGYADHRDPQSSHRRPRGCDVPLDTAVGQLVAHIRQVRPDIVITHDAYGQVTGHPDHRRTHEMTLLAVTAAGLRHLYPDTGPRGSRPPSTSQSTPRRAPETSANCCAGPTRRC